MRTMHKRINKRKKTMIRTAAALAAASAVMCSLCGCTSEIADTAQDVIGTLTGQGASGSSGAVFGEEDAVRMYGEPEVATEGLSGFAYDQLPENIRAVYAQLYTGIAAEKPVVVIRAADTDEIKQAMTALLTDCPEFFWLNGNASMNGYTEAGIWQVTVGFDTDASEIEDVRAAIESAAREYLDTLQDGASEYDKVRAAYEYIIRTTVYDCGAKHSQNIRSVFVNRRSVCAGYARALQYLLKKAGVWCAFIEGTAGDEGHAWNLVRIDGTYTLVDPSWGDPTYREDSADASRLDVIYDYLCVSSDEMRRVGHTPKGTYELPECTDRTYDYYILNGMYYDYFDTDAVSDALWRTVDAGGHSVYMKFRDNACYEEAKAALFPAEGGTESLLDAPIRQQMEWDAASTMNYYYSFSDELFIIKIYW